MYSESERVLLRLARIAIEKKNGNRIEGVQNSAVDFG